jgi:hypothetical protein
MLAGTVTTGGVVSTTVALKLPEAMLPAASVAAQVTVVAPGANVLPEGGVHVTVGLGELALVALAVKVTTRLRRWWPPPLCPTAA